MQEADNSAENVYYLLNQTPTLPDTLYMKKYLDQVKNTISADYFEIRLQEGVGNRIHYRGEQLESIGETCALGGSVRVLVDGRWGFASFNNIAEIKRYAQMACAQAQAAVDATGKGTDIVGSLPPVLTDIHEGSGIDFVDIGLEEKHHLAKSYNDILLAQNGITSTSVSYSDRCTKHIFCNSEGSEITTVSRFCGLSLSAQARIGSNVQNAYHSVGDLRGFEIVKNLEPFCESVCKRALDQLNAKAIEAGTYDVILDPKLAGVFIHEAFGHLSEADFIHENPDFAALMELGRVFGPSELNVVDDPTLENEAGSYCYDSQGVKAQRVKLIDNGILAGRLHSRETAAHMNEETTGHGRAINYSHTPIVRMSNTFIENGSSHFEEMLASTENGLYAKGSLGGQTNTEMFTFSAEEGCIINAGKRGAARRDIVLTGNVFETLKNIELIGNDCTIYGGMGGCGKGGQSPLRVSCGAPHIKIKNVVIGGC